MDNISFEGPVELARNLQGATSRKDFWIELDQALQKTFGHKLFTVLAYAADKDLMMRLYSNQPAINPIGGAKTVTDSFWTRHVLREGKIYVGSTRDDIKSVFSEYEKLWSIGCESVLNIPVRSDGVTVGTLNLLDEAGWYDSSDRSVALLFAQMAVGPLQKFLESIPDGPAPGAKLEHV